MYLADVKRALDVLGPKLVQIYGHGEAPMTITGVTTESSPTSSRLTVQLGVVEGIELAQTGNQRLRLFLDAGSDIGVARDLYRALVHDVRSIEVVGGDGTAF